MKSFLSLAAKTLYWPTVIALGAFALHAIYVAHTTEVFLRSYR